MDKIHEKILTDLMDSRGALKLFNMIHESSSSSESSEDEEDQALRLMEQIDNYNERDFKSQFRLNRSTAEYIVSNFTKFGASTISSNHGGRPRIGCKKEVLVFLFYLGNTVTFKELGEIFGIPKSSAWFAVGRVSGWLVSIGDEYIKWPHGEKVKENAKKFAALNRMPGVLGVINCTRIKTNCTIRNKSFPKKRKRNIHIIFQAVVGADKKFIDIDMSCGVCRPGSLHHNRTLRKSTLYKKAEANYKNLFPYDTFLIGNSSYKNSNWLIPPFNDQMSTTESDIKFNKAHLSTQKVGSDALAIFKSRFRRITKFTEQRWIKGAMNIVASACILHNMCIVMNDNIEFEAVEAAPSAREHEPEEDLQNLEIDRRQLLFNYMCQKNII